MDGCKKNKIDGCPIVNAVSVILINLDKKILALKRSGNKKWYPNKWDIVSGKIKSWESPDGCFQREVFEEIGVSDFQKVERGIPFLYEESGKKWLVHPYKCVIGTDSFKLNSEHSEFKWMTLKELPYSEHAKPLRKELSVFFKINSVA